MRIFTLGKNGIPLFFFALIFSGTFSSYGQQCPTVSDHTQEFCDSMRATVADLQATSNSTEAVRWYSSTESTTPLSSGQFLTSRRYFAGTASTGPCADEFVDVTVVGPPEILGVKATTFENQAVKQSLATIGICVADVNNPGVYVRDFRTNAPSEDDVSWFRSNSTSAIALDPGAELENGEYYVQYNDPNLGCSTTRRRTIVTLYSEDAPTGPAEQTFCESDNPTLSDIQASGTNRYYTAAEGGAELSENTELSVGTETYYLSSFGDTCESVERLAVTVTVTSSTLVEETAEYCGSIGTGDDFHAPTVGDLNPQDANWYADEALTDLLDSSEELVSGSVYYYDPVSDDCSVTGVEVTILDNPNAGRTSQESFCENAGEINLVDYVQPSTVSGEPDRNGSFNHPAFNGGTTFNTADLEPGVYNLTYTVPANGDCPQDTSSFTLTIQEAPNAGGDFNESICSNELVAEFSSFFEGRDSNGSFDLNTTEPIEDYTAEELLTSLFGQYQMGVRNFSVTYNVSNENCTDSAQIDLTVLDSPNAGDGGEIQLIANTENTITLTEALEGSPEPGGTWTDEGGNVVAGDLTPQEAGDFTYTVESENGCVATSTVVVLAAPQDCPVVSEPSQEFCSSITTAEEEFKRPTISDLEPSTATWYATQDSQEALAPDFELVDGGVYFAGNESGTCEDRPSVTVTILPKPNAGRTSQVSFCQNEAAVNLVDYIQASISGPPHRNGTFSPSLENQIFDPANYEPGTYTFTYRVPANADCDGDSSVIRVTVVDAPNAGDDVSEEYCVSSEEDLPTTEEFLANYADDNRDQNGTFNPTLDALEADFNENPYGTFSTVYSVTANGCTDTASLSVTITQEVPANAGQPIAENVCSTAGVQNLSDFLSEDAVQGGSFSAPYEDGTFDPTTAGSEPVVITYTINGEVACVSGEESTTITLTVIQGPDAGEDGSITLNVADEPVNLYDSLNGTPDQGGTWSPGNANGDLDPSTLAAGTYDYTYTVTSENGCQDVAIVTVTIEGEIVCPEVTQNNQAFCESILTGNDSRKPRVSDLLPAGATWYASADATVALPGTTDLVDQTTYFAGNSNGTCEERQSVTVTINDSPNAGATTQVTFCENADPIDLLTVFNHSISGAPDPNGTFSPALASGTTVFDPSVDAAGSYTYIVEGNGTCDGDRAVIAITISPSANAGPDYSVEFCTTQEPTDLTETLAEGIDTNGTFEGLEGNIFDPSAYEVGSYDFTYTVTVEGTCDSTDSSIVTVTVSEGPAAPTAEPQSFCAVDQATVADLTAEGDNLLWYTDEDLSTLADEEDLLVEGTYYVTTTTEGGCESEATAVPVTISDSASPTFTQGGNVFCEFDNPTIADLEANVNGGSITWYDAATGGNTLASSQALQNGMTYYAASSDATSDCESSVRLSVTVTLEDCEIIIPEAFSPNGDGINDRFEVQYLASEYPNYTIEIYNRWGNKVFQGNASTPNWDGVSTESRSLGDKVLPVGVYFYIVNYNDGQTAPTQGRLYLSR